MANGQFVRILENPWISELLLVVDAIMLDTSAINPGTKVSHFIIYIGEWDTTRLGTIFHPLVVDTISAISIPHKSNEDVVL